MRRIFLALLLGGVSTAQAQGTAVRDSATAAITRFFYAWESAWMDSELRRFPEQRDTLKPDIHCHVPDLERELPINSGIMLRSAYSAFAVCPIWRYRIMGVSDERLVLDAALDTIAQPEARAARDTLIGILEPLLAAAPADTFLVAQVVRFLVDQREWARAYTAATQCRAVAWWCALLEGYVFARRQLAPDSERAYRRAFALAPAGDRCAWDDLRDLIDKLDRRDCTARAAQADTIWWLADPLWSAPGNERFVEQMTREMHVRIRSMLPRDERWSWTPRRGNDARALMTRRYGWPAYVHMGGWNLEAEHDEYLLNQMIPSALNKPYTSYEYTHGRQELLPNAAVLADPFGAPPEAWPWPFIERTEWPREHAALPYPLSGVPPGQIAMLRRTDSIRFAHATVIPQDMVGRWEGTTVPAVLVRSDGPGHADLLSATDAMIGDVVRFDGMLSGAPTMLGVELLPEVAILAPAARSRFGVRPPPPLASFTAGMSAMSDPIVLWVDSGATSPRDPEGALRQMAPSRVVTADMRSIGIYWESYGIPPDDTVEVAVWVRPIDERGVVGRIGSLLGLRPGLATPVVTSWVEGPGAQGRTIVEQGPVPIVGRGVTLDVGAVTPGAYYVEVTVSRPGVEGPRGRTRIDIVR